MFFLLLVLGQPKVLRLQQAELDKSSGYVPPGSNMKVYCQCFCSHIQRKHIPNLSCQLVKYCETADMVMLC